MYRNTSDDNIKVGFKDITWKAVDWMYMCQDMVQRQALVNVLMNIQFP
jgi:hypothetical protein